MPASVRQILSLDPAWKFHLGDIAAPVPTDKHIAAYMANKAGWARGAAKPDYDDSDWRTVDLPHDWSIEGPFDPKNYIDNGFLPRGVGWYRRHFQLSESDRGRYLAIQFDGISSHCTVYLNGHVLHRHYCGYTPFTIEIGDVARYGNDVNTLAVRVDAVPIEGWWYEGAGIYRHVHLIRASAVHIAGDGVFVNPVRMSSTRWDTKIETTIANSSDSDVRVRVLSRILDADHADFAESEVTVPARSKVTLHQSIETADPTLWSCESPNLYRLATHVFADDTLIDEATTTFGYRTIRFDPDHGFFLNEQPVKLKGTCNHQDHAGVGVAVPDSIHEFRIRRLLEMGSNAYRSAHHPPAPALLDTCDRLGMLVMDENRTFGSSPEHLAQLRSMVLRDRNHPSVIAWSLCNEEAIQGTSVGANIAKAMMAEVKRLDPSRPVTAAVSGGILNDDCIADAVEVMGLNYQLHLHDPYHAKHPHVPLIAAETHCVLSTRGCRETDPSRYALACDDTAVQPWGATARTTWREVNARPFVAGLFAWTGFDYRGEPTPHGWPCVSAQMGMLDTCGFPKAGFFLHKAFFAREPFVHLDPHWTWSGEEGKSIKVTAYTNCDAVELRLNGESLGRKAVDPIEMASWSVVYQPGTLQAIAFRAGVEIAEYTATTTGPAVALGLEIDPTAPASFVLADGKLAFPVTVFAIDAHGMRVPTADNAVSFSLDGEARILGIGNGDPTSHELDQSPSRRLFQGLAQVVLQTTTIAGTITLSATSPNCRPVSLVLRSSPAGPQNTVPPAKRRKLLTDWRMSGITPMRPDVHQAGLEQDVNSWDRIEPGKPQSAWTDRGGYAIYRAVAKPTKAIQSSGGTIIFHGIAGAAEVYLDSQLAASKYDPAPDRVIIELPAAKTEFNVALLLHASAVPAGLVGEVELLARG